MKTYSKEKPDLKDVAVISETEKAAKGAYSIKKDDKAEIELSIPESIGQTRKQLALSCLKLSLSINSDIDSFNQSVNIAQDIADLDGYAKDLITERACYFKRYTNALRDIEDTLRYIEGMNFIKVGDKNDSK